MMTTLYVSTTAVQDAVDIQARHCDDGEGWCRFCLRHFSTRVRTGECLPAWRAGRLIGAYKDQLAGQRQRSRPPSPGR